MAIELPNIPENFVWFDPSQRQESVQLAFSRLLNLIQVNVGSEVAFMPKNVDALMEERLDLMEASVIPNKSPALVQDALPLIFGLVTDLLIFLAAMAAPWRDDDFSEPLDSLSRLKHERPTLGRDFFLRMESFVDPKQIPESYRLLQEHAVTFGGTDYILVAEPPMEERDIRTRYLMEFLVNAKVAEVFRPMMAGEKAPKAWARILAAKRIDDTDSFPPLPTQARVSASNGGRAVYVPSRSHKRGCDNRGRKGLKPGLRLCKSFIFRVPYNRKGAEPASARQHFRGTCA